MARPKKSAQPKAPTKKGRQSVDEKYEFSDNIAENMSTISTVPAFNGHSRNKATVINAYWPRILEAAKLGYELSAISKAMGIHRKTLWQYMVKNPDKRREYDAAQNSIRDLCVNVILDAAKKGNWLPAAWMLERTRGMEFAKPEVKLQFWDRQMSNDSVEQRIAGKSIKEISEELRTQYQGDNNVEKYLAGSKRFDAPETGSNVDLQPGEDQGPKADT